MCAPLQLQKVKSVKGCRWSKRTEHTRRGDIGSIASGPAQNCKASCCMSSVHELLLQGRAAQSCCHPLSSSTGPDLPPPHRAGGEEASLLEGNNSMDEARGGSIATVIALLQLSNLMIPNGTKTQRQQHNEKGEPQYEGKYFCRSFRASPIGKPPFSREKTNATIKLRVVRVSCQRENFSRRRGTRTQSECTQCSKHRLAGFPPLMARLSGRSGAWDLSL